MTAHQLVNQSSGEVEYYTDPKLTGAASGLFGGIELDPASSSAANASVRAQRYFGKDDDGMKQDWRAESLWLNHPFGRYEEPCKPDCQKDHVHHDFLYYGNEAWINKLDREYESRRFKEGCNITFAATSEKWFQPLMQRPQCYLSPRTNYYLPNGEKKTGVTKGSAITYFGPRIKEFADAFEQFGTIKVKFPLTLNIPL